MRVLTNSAASHDVLPALAGYVNTRRKLLNAGVELYELRPDTNMKRDWSMLAGESRAALHAKVLVFDRKSVFIGSFNLDPRSTALNTEIGVMIDSPEIASDVGELMDEGVSSGSAFHVTLDESDKLVWTAENQRSKSAVRQRPGDKRLVQVCCRRRRHAADRRPAVEQGRERIGWSDLLPRDQPRQRSPTGVTTLWCHSSESLL